MTTAEEKKEPSVDEAFGKLFKGRTAVKTNRFKYQIQELEASLEQIEEALGKKKKGRIRLTEWIRSLVAWRLEGRARATVEDKAQAIRDQIEAFKKTGEIKGWLTPLTELETRATQAEYSKIRIYLMREMGGQELTEDAKTAEKQAIDLVVDQHYQTKRLEYALKKEDKDKEGNFVRFFSRAGAIDLSPLITGEIMAQYEIEFTLSMDELKKSLAPTTKDS